MCNFISYLPCFTWQPGGSQGTSHSPGQSPAPDTTRGLGATWQGHSPTARLLLALTALRARGRWRDPGPGKPSLRGCLKPLQFQLETLHPAQNWAALSCVIQQPPHPTLEAAASQHQARDRWALHRTSSCRPHSHTSEPASDARAAAPSSCPRGAPWEANPRGTGKHCPAPSWIRPCSSHWGNPENPLPFTIIHPSTSLLQSPSFEPHSLLPGGRTGFWLLAGAPWQW